MEEIRYFGQAHAQDVLGMLFDMHQNASKYQLSGVTMPRGILLIGAPGMGKTLFAYKAAQLLQKELVIIKPSNSMISDEIKSQFTYAREKKNCIVLLDELFNMIYKDEKTEGQLLAELDSHQDFLVIATTSAFEYELESHEALTRPGRFDIKINLSWPTYSDRLAFYGDKLNQLNIAYDPEVLAEITPGVSYAFMGSFVNHIQMYSLYQNKAITDDFVYALKERLNGFESADGVPSSIRLLETAIHELGHAIYGLLAGRTLTLVEMSRNGHQAKTTFGASEDGTISDYVIEMALAVSGYAAGVVVFKKHMNGAGFDFEETRNLFSQMYRNSFVIHQETAVHTQSSKEAEQMTPFYIKHYQRLMKRVFAHATHVLQFFQPLMMDYAMILVQKNLLTSKDIALLKTQLMASKYYVKATKMIHKGIR